MTEEQRGACAEYVLGTLHGAERKAFEQALASDAALAAEVRVWEGRLDSLAQAIEPTAVPRPELWQRLEVEMGRKHQFRRASVASPEVLAEVQRSRDRWRFWAIAVGFLAASSLAAMAALAVGLSRAGPPRGRDEVAVVTRAGDVPALIVRIDRASGAVRVRQVAAETPPERSLELWFIGMGESPRSLGLVGHDMRPLPQAASARLHDARLAVSVEPKGGSPTGVPTGPILYSGKLLPGGS